MEHALLWEGVVGGVGRGLRFLGFSGLTATGAMAWQAFSSIDVLTPSECFTADDIARSGHLSLGEFLRAQPFANGQSLTPEDAGTSFTPGVSTVSVRGLGNNQPLFLLNGRRTALYAMPGFDGFQSVFDLNSLPEAAIDRIEYHRGDATARYGSGAQGGVFNVILKDRFEGLEMGLRMGDYFDTAAFFRRGSAMLGTVGPQSRLFLSVSIEEREAVLARDLSYSSNADQTARARSADPRYLIENLESTGLSREEYLGAIGFDDPLTGGWFDNRSSRGFPGYVITPLGRRTWDVAAFPDGVDDPAAALGETTAAPNLYNFQERNGLFPAFRRLHFFTGGAHRLSERLEARFEAGFSRVETEVMAAAPPVDLESSRGLDGADDLTIFSAIPYDAYTAGEEPFVHPFNPFGVDLVSGRRRLVEFPGRLSEVTADTPRLFAGLTGDLGAGLGWTWEAGALHTGSAVTDISHTASDSRLQQGLLGLTRLGDGTLTWDPTTHPVERVYFNWFGRNEPAMVEHISILNPTRADYTLKLYDLTVEGPLGALPGGAARLLVGLEQREEDWSQALTELNVSGDIIGGSEGVGGAGSRRVRSARADLIAPVAEILSLQLQGRLDDSSDPGVGTEDHFKTVVELQLLEGLSLHAAYGESARSPDLAYLHVERRGTFSSLQGLTPGIGVSDAFQIVVGGNPELGPERAKSWEAGLTFAPQGLREGEGLSLSVHYLRLERSGMIDQLLDAFTVSAFLAGAAAGDPLFVGRIEVDPATGDILYLMNAYENLGTATYEGIDYALGYGWEHPDYGRFRASWRTGQLVTQSVDGRDLVGDYLMPEWRHTAHLRWERGDWAANLFGSFINARQQRRSFGAIFGTGDELLLVTTLQSQWVWNLNTTYRGWSGGEITVGVNNLFNDEPPVDPGNYLGATSGLNGLQPAQWFVQLKREF